MHGKKGIDSFALPSLRTWIFDILVGTAIVQLTKGNEDFYLSAVFHAAITKQLHRKQKELIESCFDVLSSALKKDIHNPYFKHFVKESYDDMIGSVKAYGALDIPSLEEVMKRIAEKDDDGELEGLINEVDLRRSTVITIVLPLLTYQQESLNSKTLSQCSLADRVSDREITIPNMISFFLWTGSENDAARYSYAAYNVWLSRQMHLVVCYPLLYNISPFSK